VILDASDGVEFWVGKSTWVFASSIVNIHPSKRNKVENMLLRGMITGHPKDLQAYLTVIVDDEMLWDSPQTVRDYTRDSSGPVFPCRVRVLAHVGDFPAQAKTFNHVETGGDTNCPMCKVHAQSNALMNGTKASVFPCEHDRPKPPKRTHDGMLSEMAEADRYKRFNMTRAKKRMITETGHKGLCAYARLSYVRFPWFRASDWMHGLSGILGKHLCPLLSGDRKFPPLKSPKAQYNWDKDFGPHKEEDTEEDIKETVARRKGSMRRWRAECKKRKSMGRLVAKWSFCKKTRRSIDRRYRATRGSSELVKSGGGPMGKRSKINMHGWLRYLQFLMPSLLYPDLKGERVNAEVPGAAAIMIEYLECIRTCSFRDVVPRSLPALSRRVTKAEQALMQILPSSERGLMPHLSTHAPENMLHLGPLNGYHAFPFESFYGYIKRFVHSKVHPEANVVMCMRLVTFGRILRARYPDAVNLTNADLLPQQAAKGSQEEEDQGDEDAFGLRFRRGVSAPPREKCRVRLDFRREARDALFRLLDFPVRRGGRQVKSHITVHGQKRTYFDAENTSKRSGKLARLSGVELSAQHSPAGCGRRIGVIRFVGYVTAKHHDTLHVLVASVLVFREEEVGPQGQIIIDPRNPHAGQFFVRVEDLGDVVGFVPTHVDGDGESDLNVDSVDFWDRKQYVVGCYPNE